MKKLYHITTVLILFAIVLQLSCSSVQTIKSADSIELTRNEIEDILKHDENLTPAQKIVLKHAVADLKDAQTQSKQAVKLQDKVIESSEKAGAGKLVYNIMYFIIFLIIAFAGFKIMKKFSFF